jgi:hypothetical protein
MLHQIKDALTAFNAEVEKTLSNDEVNVCWHTLTYATYADVC